MTAFAYLHYCSKVWGQIFFLKHTYIFIQQWCLNWPKGTVKSFTALQKIYNSNKCCSLKLLNQISILKWFLKDHATLKTGVMMLKIQLFHYKNKLQMKIYSNRKQIFLIVILFLLYFWPNKCTLGEHKRLLAGLELLNTIHYLLKMSLFVVFWIFIVHICIIKHSVLTLLTLNIIGSFVNDLNSVLLIDPKHK